MRRAARTDGNHADVMKAFRKMGCGVADTSRMGGGYPDLTVSLGRALCLVEVKDGARCPSEQRLTPDEVKFHARFPVEIVKDMDDVARVVGMLRKASDAALIRTLAD
jgi:hypothetical protein